MGRTRTTLPGASKLWIHECETRSGSAMDFRANMSAPANLMCPSFPFPSTSHPSAFNFANGYSSPSNSSDKGTGHGGEERRTLDRCPVGVFFRQERVELTSWLSLG